MPALDLGFKAAPKKAAKVEKPILPDPDGTLRPLVDEAVANAQEVAAHDAELKRIKAAFGEAAFAYAARLYAGRDTGVEDTFRLVGVNPTHGATIALTNRYKMPDDVAEVRELLGEHADTYLRQSFNLGIDLDAMPEMAVQLFVNELKDLARRLDTLLGTPDGEDGPVFNAITVKSTTSVAKEFHEKRWALFTPEHNARIQRVMPCTISTAIKY